MGLRVGEGLWAGWGGIKDGMGWDYVLEWDYGLVVVGLRMGLRMGWGGITCWRGIMGWLGCD